MGTRNIEKIEKDYIKLCNDYVDALLDMWDLGSRDNLDYFWVGDIAGGVFMFGDIIALNMDDIRYIVHNGLAMDYVLSWQDYCLRCHAIGLDETNLKSWHHNAPRYKEETLRRIEGMKKELDEMIAQAKGERNNDKTMF